MEFTDCIPYILQLEGGYVNDPSDPGGETKYGISKRAYPGVDIANLTTEQASDIYERDYWTPLQCANLPSKLRLPMLSFGVNAGVRSAVLALQAAVRAVPDGVLGPQTLADANAADPDDLIGRFTAHAIVHYSSSPVASTYLEGWAYRAAYILTKAA